MTSGTGVMVQELVLENFKSFGVKTRIPLRSGFTTISGPNGSGKSNLLDSLLFVLGLSSSKQLRAERLPDLITNQKGRTWARVGLVLRVPDAESAGGHRSLEIARKIRLTPAGYTSTYYVDDKVAPLQKVHDLLNDLGIGSQGGNVVLQGDVTRIITMSPLDRRRVIDELAGVAEFDRKIEAAQVEMSKAERHMEDCRLISGELETRLAALATERAAALRFQALEADRKRAEVQLVRAEIREVERKAEGFATDAAELAEGEAKAVEDLPRIEGAIEKARTALSEIEDELRRMGEGEKLEKLRELEEQKARSAGLRAEVSHAEGLLREGDRRARSLRSGIEKAEVEKAEALKIAVEARAEAAREARRAEDARHSIEERRSAMDRLASASKAKIEELHQAKDQRRNLEVELESARVKARSALEGRDRVGARLAEVDKELDELANRLKGIHELVEDADTTRSDLDKRVHDAHELVSALKHRRQEIHERRSRIEDEIRPLIKEIGAAEAQSRTSGEAVALSILRSEGVAGVIGDVQSLLRFPSDLGGAIEAAAGGRLRNLVVVDDAAAAECIRVLRNKKGPRTTFLPLNKIRGTQVTRFVEDPGLESYLIQKIQFDEKYLSAMEYVFGATVLASDLESARRYLGRYRLVTRDGDLLETSGAMTGGGNQKLKLGGGNLTHLRAQLTSRETELRRLQDEMATVEKRIHEAEEGRDRARQSLSDLDRDLARDRKDREGLLDARVKQKRRRDELAAEAAEHQAALEAATRVQGRLEGELAVLAAALSGLEAELGGGEAARLASETEELGLVAERHREEARRLEEEARRKDLEASYLAKSLEGWSQELSEVRGREEELARRVEDGRKEAATLEERVRVLSEELQGLTGEIERLRAEREKRGKHLEAMFARRSQVEARIAVAREQLAAVRLRISELEAVRTELARRLSEMGELPADLGEPPSLVAARRELDRVTQELRELGPVNLLAVEQYQELEARRGELLARLAVLEAEKAELLARISKFGDLKRSAFLEAFHAVDANFRTIYGELSEGAGELELEKAEDPFAGGLTLKAQPRHKNMERLEALSGGEKSLAALAFIFSLQGYRPAPFYVFDEVDMFLDGRNTERLADMIQRRAQGTQFLVVSLRKAMLKRSCRTIGVTPGPGGFTRVTGIEHEIMAAAEADGTGSPASATSGGSGGIADEAPRQAANA